MSIVAGISASGRTVAIDDRGGIWELVRGNLVRLVQVTPPPLWQLDGVSKEEILLELAAQNEDIACMTRNARIRAQHLELARQYARLATMAAESEAAAGALIAIRAPFPSCNGGWSANRQTGSTFPPSAVTGQGASQRARTANKVEEGRRKRKMNETDS